MIEAAETFGKFLGSFEFHNLTVPVVSNVTGQAYPPDSSGSLVKSLLVKQIVRPVLWMQSVRFLLSKGASIFTETGPGDVLTRLIGQIRGGAS
jgi:trans-AT polyketide synthase/acyltransferase/oxidoreductase domain-containing protein/rhizoxin biosynthesis acyltransferase